MKKSSVLTAVVFDPFASSVMSLEDEIKMRVDEFERLLGRRLKVYKPSSFYDEAIKPRTQLVLFDYGGVMPGNDLMDANSRRLVRWAADHPSALVAVVSQFTYNRAVKYEIDDYMRDVRHDDSGATLPNVIVRDIGDDHIKIPDWFTKGLDDDDRRLAGATEAVTAPAPGATVLRADQRVARRDGGVPRPDDLRRRRRTRARR